MRIAGQLPATPAALAESLYAFQMRLLETRSKLPTPSSGWYPFDSFAGLIAALPLLADVYEEFSQAITGKPVADVGCGDGDLALLFANWGAEVDAIDWPSTNFNQMQGVERTAQALAFPVACHRLNLDGRFEFPNYYGFTLFLGLLYHLQNPYYALDQLAHHTDWCLLSTRIAQITTPARIPIAQEPVAYLASGMEINNDATNYWIFSLAGLLRIVQRTRWAVRGILRVGCLEDSNPSDPAADERVFLLLQSRVSYPGLQARPGDGWHNSDGQPFRWTAKRFTLKVVLPLETQISGFSLALYVPDAVLPRVTIQARIEGIVCGEAAFTTEGIQPFRAQLPATALHDPDLTLEFLISSSLHHPDREYGICVPLENGAILLSVY